MGQESSPCLARAFSLTLFLTLGDMSGNYPYLTEYKTSVRRIFASNGVITTILIRTTNKKIRRILALLLHTLPGTSDQQTSYSTRGAKLVGLTCTVATSTDIRQVISLFLPFYCGDVILPAFKHYGSIMPPPLKTQYHKWTIGQDGDSTSLDLGPHFSPTDPREFSTQTVNQVVFLSPSVVWAFKVPPGRTWTSVCQ